MQKIQSKEAINIYTYLLNNFICVSRQSDNVFNIVSYIVLAEHQIYTPLFFSKKKTPNEHHYPVLCGFFLIWLNLVVPNCKTLNDI